MRPALRSAFANILERYRSGTELVLLFDYDGTLVPIVDHPRLAVIPAETRQILTELAAAPLIQLGVLSGRHLADLKQLVGIPGLYFAGTSGLELDFAGIRIRHPGAGNVVPFLRCLGKSLVEVLDEFPGAWLEWKPVGLTVHFRGIATNCARTLRVHVGRMVSAFAGHLRVLECAEALEITPVLGWHKGTAVRMIVESLRTEDLLTMYAGDSLNDSEAFATVNDMDGISIAVGPEAPPGAQISVDNPRELIEWLGELVAKISTFSVKRPSTKFDFSIAGVRPEQVVGSE